MGKLELSRYAWIESGYRRDIAFAAEPVDQVSEFTEEHGNIAFQIEAQNAGFVVVTST